MNISLWKKLIMIACLVVSNHALAIPDYSVNQNPMPGAQVTSTYDHNAGGRGVTPYYGYYVSEFPSLNDYGDIAGRTDVANSSDPMVEGSTSGQAAVWKNGVVKNVAFKRSGSCRDVDGDGNADASSCGSRALAINNLGKAGGSSHVSIAGQDSYFEQNMSWWPSSEGEYDMGGSRELSFYTISQSQIEDINNQSNVVGIGITTGGAGPQDGLAHGLVKINGAVDYIGIHKQYSRAHALNESNTVTGAILWNDTDDYTSGVSTTLKAYTWLSGELNVAQDGNTDPAYMSEGFDINDSGLVVGQMGRSNNIRPFKWSSPNGSLEDLGTLGGSQGVARSVNNAGVVVGWANTTEGATHGFIYENGVMHDLNDYASGASGFVIVDAYSINEIGQILVRAHNASTNQNQYWLLTDPDSLPSSPPEPLPDTVEITSMGAFGGKRDETPIKIMADGEGNTISIGYYNVQPPNYYWTDVTVDFDPSSAEDLFVSKRKGVYIQKLDVDGSYLWTKQLSYYGSSTVDDLFVEPDGSFHLVGSVFNRSNIDLNPDPDVSENPRKSYSDYHATFRASYSSSGELVSSAILRGSSIGATRAVSVTVDDSKNIYVVYHKDTGGGIKPSYDYLTRTWLPGPDIDFDPSDGTAYVELYYSRPAIIVTKTSRNADNSEQLEWAKSMSSTGRYWPYKRYNKYDTDYAYIRSLSIAVPAVAGEGPMLAFSYRGGINFQVVDSNLGLVGESQIVDTEGVFRSGFIRMSESGGPSVLWMDSGSSGWHTKVKLARGADYFGMLLGVGSVTSSLIHGVATEAGVNHIYRALAGQNHGVSINQQGDIYTSGYVGDTVNFDTTGYDVQGYRANFITKINGDGSYGWTITHDFNGASSGFSSVAIDRFDNVTAVGRIDGSGSYDQNGDLIPVIRSSGGYINFKDVLLTRVAPVQQ